MCKRVGGQDPDPLLGDVQVMLKSLGQSLLINMVIGFTVPSIDNWCVPRHAAGCSNRPGSTCIADEQVGDWLLT